MEALPGGFIKLSKSAKNLNVTVDIYEKMKKWLLDMVFVAEREPERLGFIGIHQSSMYDYSVMIKVNKGGHFITLLVRSTLYTSGRRYICIPRGEAGRGWHDVIDALEHFKGQVTSIRKIGFSGQSRVSATTASEASIDLVQELWMKGVKISCQEGILIGEWVAELVKTCWEVSMHLNSI